MKKLFSLLLLSCLSSLMFAQSSIIHAGQLFNQSNSGFVAQQSILVLDGKISDIRSGYLSASDFGVESARIIDLKDAYVLPGLIDCHVHLTGERKADAIPHEWTTLEREDEVLESIPYLSATIEAGFTTVRDLGANPNTIKALKRAVSKGIIKGPKIVAALNAVTPTGGHGEDHLGYREEILHAFPVNKAVCNGADDCRRAVRDLVRQGADVIKVTATGGVLSNTKAGVSQQLTDDELNAIVETAEQLGRKVAAHAHGTDGINAALKAGVHSVEHASFLDDSSIRLFTQSQAYYVPTLLAGVALQEEMVLNPNIPAKIIDKINFVVPSMKEAFQAAMRNKVNIAFGTDAGVFKHGINAREFEIMVEYGMSPLKTIQTATTHAATLLGMENNIGKIAPDFAADIIAVPTNPLENISVLKQVKWVMKDGQIEKE